MRRYFQRKLGIECPFGRTGHHRDPSPAQGDQRGVRHAGPPRQRGQHRATHQQRYDDLEEFHRFTPVCSSGRASHWRSNTDLVFSFVAVTVVSSVRVLPSEERV